jgi:hypothetical protein
MVEDRQQEAHVAECAECGCELYGWESAYSWGAEYVCERCVEDWKESHKVILSEVLGDEYWR